MKHFTLFFALLISIFILAAQTPGKYWVQFKTKDSEYSTKEAYKFLSPQAIANRAKYNIPITEQDLPLGRKHIQVIKNLDSTIVILTKSKWMNGVTVYSENPNFVSLMKECEVVDYVEITCKLKELETFPKTNANFFVNEKPVSDIPNDLDYGKGTKQIQINNIHWLHRMGFKGEGVLLQIQDGGFLNSDQIRHFQQHFKDNRVRAVKNFVLPNKSTFRDGSHGTGVWSCMAAYLPGELIGSSPAANFVLVQTEDNRYENVIEEDNWVAGLEFADSLGVQVLNSSLGYTTFDDSLYYRSYESLDGKSSRASKAADIAVTKGMVVVNSAGNEGRGKWHFVGVPAEANNILAIGAINAIGAKGPFSSFGPTFDGRVKPDGAAVGWNTFVGLENDQTTIGSGTSYASPMFAGMVTCIRQAFPNKNAFEIIDAVRKSGAQYTAPDSALGYGITDFLKAFNILLQPKLSKLNCIFHSYVVTSTNLSFIIDLQKATKITLQYGVRSAKKPTIKEFELQVGKNEIVLPIDKLSKKQKYDFVDILIKNGNEEYKFVLGRE